MRFLKIDDPVSCIPVHLFCGIWGLLVVAIFGEKVEHTSRYNGLTRGGPAIYLGYQLLAVVCITAWAAFASGIQVLHYCSCYNKGINFNKSIILED